MECCIIVLPDVLAAAQSFVGSLVSRRIECGGSMHDWAGVASDAPAAIFRGAEDALARTPAILRIRENREPEQGLSNEALARTS
jgi:hypothetical protein